MAFDKVFAIAFRPTRGARNADEPLHNTQESSTCD